MIDKTRREATVGSNVQFGSLLIPELDDPFLRADDIDGRGERLI